MSIFGFSSYFLGSSFFYSTTTTSCFYSVLFYSGGGGSAIGVFSSAFLGSSMILVEVRVLALSVILYLGCGLGGSGLKVKA